MDTSQKRNVLMRTILTIKLTKKLMRMSQVNPSILRVEGKFENLTTLFRKILTVAPKRKVSMMKPRSDLRISSEENCPDRKKIRI